jgi:NAD(P)-dependent dehydrogenase (short-subunit alcohol dehydrogenase family)
MAIKRNPRSVLVTGGTGSVGKALVEVFAAKDYRVTFQYRHDKSTAEQLEKTFGAESIQLDFEDEFVLTQADFDVVVNNAGINISDVPAHEVSIQNWNRTLRVWISFGQASRPTHPQPVLMLAACNTSAPKQ